MNGQTWYLYKNDQTIAGPVNFMSAVAAMNRLTVIGYPGSTVFQRTKVYKVGADTYELSTQSPTERNAQPIGIPARGPAFPKPAQNTMGTTIKPTITIVGVRFEDEARAGASSIYHFKTDLSFKPGDKAVIYSPEKTYKIVTVQYIRAEGQIQANAWIVDKIDLTRHQVRLTEENTQKVKAERAEQIRRELDAKLASTQEIKKYESLGDSQSAALVAELRRLTQ